MLYLEEKAEPWIKEIFQGKKKQMQDSVPTVVIPAALLERDALVVERFDNAVLPLGAVVARPAVRGAVGQVGRGRHGNAAAGSGHAGGRGRRGGVRVWRRRQGQQRRRVLRRLLLLGAGHDGGVVAVGLLPLQLELRLEVCEGNREQALKQKISELLIKFTLILPNGELNLSSGAASSGSCCRPPTDLTAKLSTLFLAASNSQKY